MRQKPRQLQPSLSVGHPFGARLRQYRAEAGLPQQRLGRLINISGDRIGKVKKVECRPIGDRFEAEERGVRLPTRAIEREMVLSWRSSAGRLTRTPTMSAWRWPDLPQVRCSIGIAHWSQGAMSRRW